MKKTVMGAAGAVGGFIMTLFGGWTTAMTTLLIFMGIDWISGMICAGIFKASSKTENGGLSSKVGFRGLSKKCMILLFVLVGARLDLIIGVPYIRDAVCVAFIMNELISIIENAGLMGVPVPKAIAGALDALQGGKNGVKNENDQNNA